MSTGIHTLKHLKVSCFENISYIGMKKTYQELCNIVVVN